MLVFLERSLNNGVGRDSERPYVSSSKQLRSEGSYGLNSAIFLCRAARLRETLSASDGYEIMRLNSAVSNVSVLSNANKCFGPASSCGRLRRPIICDVSSGRLV